MQCDNAELLSDGAEFSAAESVQRIYKLALLCKIGQALDPSMNCDPATLLSDGAAFACLSPELQRIVELQLLCEISGSTSGLSTQVTCGATDPVGAPPAGCSLYYNKITTALFESIGGAWVLKV